MRGDYTSMERTWVETGFGPSLTVDCDIDGLPDVVLDAVGGRAGVRALHGLGGQREEQGAVRELLVHRHPGEEGVPGVGPGGRGLRLAGAGLAAPFDHGVGEPLHHARHEDVLPLDGDDVLGLLKKLGRHCKQIRVICCSSHI